MWLRRLCVVVFEVLAAWALVGVVVLEFAAMLP